MQESLLQAAGNAPVKARGFRIQCHKWAVLVYLLLGEIPERLTFKQKGLEALNPYFELTSFRTVIERFSNTFIEDRTHDVNSRLRHSVIRTGIRNISTAFSCISFEDIANKFWLQSENPVADTESVQAKAIRDGVINAKLDHAKSFMVSKETEDVYCTNEPQAALNSRSISSQYSQ